MTQAIGTVLALIAILAGAVLWAVLLGWILVGILGWFGLDLAIWQGAVIMLFVSIVFGSSQ